MKLSDRARELLERWQPDRRTFADSDAARDLFPALARLAAKIEEVIGCKHRECMGSGSLLICKDCGAMQRLGGDWYRPAILDALAGMLAEEG